jgi:mRNA interferase RelE/StbE
VREGYKVYEIVITESAKKDIKKLTNNIIQRILEKIEELSKNPRPAGCKKLVGSSLYRIRIGDYRVIYNIDDKVLVVDVRKVGHRKNIYE